MIFVTPTLPGVVVYHMVFLIQGFTLLMSAELQYAMEISILRYETGVV
jgi:hypothetical protein